MAKNQDKTKVTRITASEDTESRSKVKLGKAAPTKSVKTKKNPSQKRKRSFGVLGKVGGYFKGAWQELRQVHWPTRRATWGLTGAVLLFSAFFVVFITLLDVGFKFIFEQILR